MASRVYFQIVACGLLVAMASPVGEHWVWGEQASVVVACDLRSCGLQALEYRLSTCGTQA